MKNSWGGSRKGAGRPRRDIDLVSMPEVTPKASDAAGHAKISSRAAMDSVVMGYGSSIDIPRTPLSRGAKFGETITPQGLRFATRREPLAKRLITDIAEDIFDKWFKLEPIIAGDNEKANTTLDQSAQKILERLNAKFNFIRAAQYEREFGWSIIVLGFKDNGTLDSEVQNPTELNHLAVYSPRSTTVEKEDENPESPASDSQSPTRSIAAKTSTSTFTIAASSTLRHASTSTHTRASQSSKTSGTI